MIREPVVSREEPAIVAACPTCEGSKLFCIARFMTADDLKELARLKALGFQEVKGSLKSLGSVDECECKPGRTATSAPSPMPARPERKPAVPTGRPRLSLKRG